MGCIKVSPLIHSSIIFHCWCCMCKIRFPSLLFVPPGGQPLLFSFRRASWHMRASSPRRAFNAAWFVLLNQLPHLSTSGRITYKVHFCLLFFPNSLDSSVHPALILLGNLGDFSADHQFFPSPWFKHFCLSYNSLNPTVRPNLWPNSDNSVCHMIDSCKIFSLT